MWLSRFMKILIANRWKLSSKMEKLPANITINLVDLQISAFRAFCKTDTYIGAD